MSSAQNVSFSTPKQPSTDFHSQKKCADASRTSPKSHGHERATHCHSSIGMSGGRTHSASTDLRPGMTVRRLLDHIHTPPSPMPPTPPMQPLVASAGSSRQLFHDESLILGYVLCALVVAGMCIAAWKSLRDYRACDGAPVRVAQAAEAGIEMTDDTSPSMSSQQQQRTSAALQSPRAPPALPELLSPDDLERELEAHLTDVQLQPHAWQFFLLAAYAHYPPPALTVHEVAAELVAVAKIAPMSAGVTRALRRAFILYHPDKNLPTTHGIAWSATAGQLSRMATNLREYYRLRIPASSDRETPWEIREAR